MANYNNLLSTINGAIKTNGTGAITGQLLQTILDGMVASLGAKYQYAGVATPSTNPGTPDENVFYLATQAGTYTNFRGLVVDDGEVCALKWDGTWVKEVTGAATAEQVSQLGQYKEDNPEWIKVVTDNNDRILYGIKTDGKFYFGDGCPPQVQEYIQNVIDGLSLDEYEDIVTFLGNLIDGDTLATLLNEKVDKVIGNSLINSEFATSQEVVTNPEYLQVTTDSEDKILEGIKQDGTKVIGGNAEIGGNTSISGDATILGKVDIQGATYTLQENPEWIKVLTDAQDRIIAGVRKDGNVYIGQLEIPASLQSVIDTLTADNVSLDERLQALESIISITQNPEFIQVTTDSEGKVLQSRTPEGVNKEYVGIESPKVSIDGATIENIQDPEGRTEIKTDLDGKILSYRDSDGVIHENVGIESAVLNTNLLNLTTEGMIEFQQALKNSGFRGGSGDWSDYISNDGESPLCIPEPRCAMLNIISDYNLSNLSKEGYPGSQEGVNYNLPTIVEFWDMQGNYFKKPTLMSAQGASTMLRPKKNLAFDFFDTDNYDDALKIKFGNWISQDSFHLKAYETESTKAKAIVSYKLYDEIVKSRGELADYTWKKGLIDQSNITSTSSGLSSISEFDLQLDNGATCFPLGFPVIVYQNGSFYGIYVWQLKKHRDNYKMDKKNAEHIHLDGEIFDFFSYGGNINWNVIAGLEPDSIGVTGDLEIRNPKDLYLMNGTKYNADTNRGELMDSTSSYYDSTNKNHVRTNDVKQNMIASSSAMANINAAKDVYEASSKTAQDLATFKAVFETYFDPDNLIDYLIISDLISNWDGFNHNAQWTTWNGLKWYVNMYDVDNTFGGVSYPPNPSHITRFPYTAMPMFLVLIDYYTPELNARYAELREKGIIDANHIMSIFNDWQQRYSQEMFDKEYGKWKDDLQSLGQGFDSTQRIAKYVSEEISYMDTLYQYNN